MGLALFHILTAIMASCRLTEVVTIDQITASFRGKHPNWYLLSCARCVSVWAGIVCSVLFVYTPFLNWPLALSWLYITYADRVMLQLRLKTQKELIVRMDKAGAYRLLKSDFTQIEMGHIIKGLMAQFSGRPPVPTNPGVPL